jgi:hypothetical protein
LASNLVATATLRLGANQDRDNLELVLARADARIRGVVLLPDGSPASGAEVTAYSQDDKGRTLALSTNRVGRSYSSSTGAFTIEDLPGGTVTVAAEYGNYPRAEARNVAANADSVRLQLRAGARILGVAVAPDGRPLTAFRVTLSLSDAQAAEASGEYVSAVLDFNSPTGEFEVDDIVPGSYDLFITTPAGETAKVKAMNLKEGETRNSLRVLISQK